MYIFIIKIDIRMFVFVGGVADTRLCYVCYVACTPTFQARLPCGVRLMQTLASERGTETANCRVGKPRHIRCGEKHFHVTNYAQFVFCFCLCARVRSRCNSCIYVGQVVSRRLQRARPWSSTDNPDRVPDWSLEGTTVSATTVTL